MARTARTATQITRAGVAQTLTAVDSANGEKITIVSKTMFLVVANASGGSINVSLTRARKVDGDAPAAKVIAVANGATKLIGPFPAGDYAQSDGTVHVDYSAGTSVTAGAFYV